MRLSLGAQRVLDELLGDRRAALGRRLGEHVLDERAPDADEVDAAVLVEALVLDRHHGLLDVERDLARVDEDALLVAVQRRELGAVAVVDDRVLRVAVLLAILERRQVLGDGHHDPEDPGDEREHARGRAAPQRRAASSAAVVRCRSPREIPWACGMRRPPRRSGRPVERRISGTRALSRSRRLKSLKRLAMDIQG